METTVIVTATKIEIKSMNLNNIQINIIILFKLILFFIILLFKNRTPAQVKGVRFKNIINMLNA